jgi:uncharacterized cupredoxin-like copper-binding protein
MNMGVPRWSMLAVLCFISAGCHTGALEKNASFRIVATDAAFEAPKRVASGMRHIIFENHGSEIHEGMLVKLPHGMSPNDYVAAVKRGALFPKGAVDCSGPGLTSPGEKTEIWLRLDPGQYVLICSNDGHARTRSAHPFTVDYADANDVVPKDQAVLKLVDVRFEIEGNLRSGPQVIRVETPGPTIHEVDFFRLHDGKIVADLKRWRKENPGGPAPADALGGARDMISKELYGCERSFHPDARCSIARYP